MNMVARLRIGTRVKIVNLPDNLDDETKAYEGATGEIKAYGSPSDKGEQGYYIRMDDGRYSKRFYTSELERK